MVGAASSRASLSDPQTRSYCHLAALSALALVAYAAGFADPAFAAQIGPAYGQATGLGDFCGETDHLAGAALRMSRYRFCCLSLS